MRCKRLRPCRKGALCFSARLSGLRGCCRPESNRRFPSWRRRVTSPPIVSKVWRALLLPEDKRAPFGSSPRRRRHKNVTSVEFAGRWSLLRSSSSASSETDAATNGAREGSIEEFARILLKRYGVVSRRLAAKETFRVPWFELLRAFRRLEARGEIRGGYFVGGLSGEQFARPEAIGYCALSAKRRPKVN